MFCKKAISLVLPFVVAGIAGPTLQAEDSKKGEPVQSVPRDLTGLVEGENKFAFDLYRRLRAGDDDLFFSPAGISTALAMAYAGARGNTAAEMAKTLHFPESKERLDDEMQALQSAWNMSPKDSCRLHLANRLWGQKSDRFLPEFLRITRTYYGAELARLDFSGEPEQSRQTINQWVLAQTENKIANLIPSAAVLQSARLVLTNAVYFQGNWAHSFGKHATKEADFHVSANKKVKVPMMHQQHAFDYAAADGVQALALSYGDGAVSMIVLLPQSSDGLARLEEGLNPGAFTKWRGAMTRQQVIVEIPRFKTTAQFELNGTLRSMGMASAFDAATADFSGMTGAKDLLISAVLHKAFVDVDERGTEAAAATGIVMRATAVRVEPSEPIVFRADHPFVYLIRDNRNGAILFLGRLNDPSK